MDSDVTLETPFACCKVQGSFPDVSPVDDDCAVTATAVNSNYMIVSYWLSCIANSISKSRNPIILLKLSLFSFRKRAKKLKRHFYDMFW